MPGIIKKKSNRPIAVNILRPGRSSHLFVFLDDSVVFILWIGHVIHIIVMCASYCTTAAELLNDVYLRRFSVAAHHAAAAAAANA